MPLPHDPFDARRQPIRPHDVPHWDERMEQQIEQAADAATWQPPTDGEERDRDHAYMDHLDRRYR